MENKPSTELTYDACAELHRKVLHIGSGLRVGEKTQLSAVKDKVMQGQEIMARARSATFAQRIARALNLMRPDRRGK